MQAKLSPEAAEAWYAFCEEQGRTFTSIIEAFGLELAEGSTPIPKRVVERAKSIDAARHSRRRR